MRLKSIEMQGFKSFADKIYLDFNSGITAIVGPNGSGKSNIGDAVATYLHEEETSAWDIEGIRGKYFGLLCGPDDFKELTGERYNAVILDRAFRMAAEPQGDTVYRDTQFLSAGAADQLYLALRLAVAEELTPSSPLVLDDALVRFDDSRLASAMEILKEEAQNKQVILFTCQSREAAYE